MKITKLIVENFRGISKEEYELDDFTVFTGKCGAGKSSVMKALQFVLTGVYDKTDVRFDSAKSSVTLVFEDGMTISRVRKSDKVECRADGRVCTATALNDFIEAKTGASIKVVEAMCSSDYYEALESKDLTKFILSILPVQINFDRMITFLEEQIGRKVSEPEKQHLSDYFSSQVFGLPEIESAYKKAFDMRKAKKTELKAVQGKTVFEGNKPDESKEELEKIMGELAVKESKVNNYHRALDDYNRKLKQRQDAIVRKEELQKELDSYISVEKPDETLLGILQSDKMKFEEAIRKSSSAIATSNANLDIFRRTLDNLDKPVCPVSEKLICTTDKSGLKTELQQLVDQNVKTIEETEEFVARCKDQITKRDVQIEEYNNNLVAYSKKAALQTQYDNIIIPDEPEPVEEIKVDDLDKERAEISRKMQLLAEYEVASKAKIKEKELKDEVDMLEFAVMAFDVKNGVRNKIMENTLSPLQAMVDDKAKTVSASFKVSMASEAGLDIKISNDGGTHYIPMKNVSSGEFIMVAYLMMSIISEITGVTVLLLDNLDKLDSDSFSNLMSLLSKDKQYENIVVSMVDHDDTIKALSKKKGIKTISL